MSGRKRFPLTVQTDPLPVTNLDPAAYAAAMARAAAPTITLTVELARDILRVLAIAEEEARRSLYPALADDCYAIAVTIGHELSTMNGASDE